ncbi:hypothetical protein F5887DRAFT_1128115 [Amanita rubescens]|nr:hypothetical protein F5887DRAFT_1128115 [Amanita rubescens]
MFFCRRQLLQVHFRKFGPCHFDVRIFSSRSSWPTPSFDSAERMDRAQRRGPSLPPSRAFKPHGQTNPTVKLQSTLDRLEQSSCDTNIATLEMTIQAVTLHLHEAEYQPLIRRLLPLLIKHLRKLRVPTGTESITYKPPPLVYRTFNFAHKLVICSRKHLALELLHVLFDQGFIPSEAIQNCKDIRTSVFAALVRASLYWGWRHMAARILLHHLRKAQPSDQFVFELAVDTSYALLVTPNRMNIRDCLFLFLEMHRMGAIPSGIVRQFYDSASEHFLGEEVTTFYSFTRLPAVELHRYPPPQGKALTWLMKYLSTDSKRTHLSRALVDQVVAENLPVIAQDRARFITFAASQSYSFAARQLWSRYSTGKDNHLVVGNTSLMLRMTSLYAYLIRRTNSQLQAATADNKKDDLNHQLNDLVSFRDQVFSSFKEYHTPLESATHEVVTSFARACFIVGETTEGFEALRLMFQKKEIPDMYDINVAISGVAQLNPRSAIPILNKLKRRGFRPDAVSYATVMHFAKEHGDSELALEMMDELCRLDKKQMNLKSIAALVRATVTFEAKETKELQRQKLREAMDIIMRLTSNGFFPSPQTGKYLVVSSLRAEDPKMAYRFWSLFLRETAEWDDHEQFQQRALISKNIVLHRRRGLLSEDEARSMLKLLNRPPGIW